MAAICEDWNLEFSLFAYTVTCCITSIVYHRVTAKKLHSQHIVPCVVLLHSLVLASMLLNVNLPKFFPFVEAIVFGVCDPLLFCYVKGKFTLNSMILITSNKLYIFLLHKLWIVNKHWTNPDSLIYIYICIVHMIIWYL